MSQATEGRRSTAHRFVIAGSRNRWLFPSIVLALLVSLTPALWASDEEVNERDLDTRVRQFLESHRNEWHDLNVPMVDGKVLYDLIVENGYTRALELGTSTGHSAIWIAWALSKTGGKLTTVEIDEHRYREALAKFKEAGLSDHIDARLADAHELVPQLEGPFDFIFVDADKGWYTRYFEMLLPQLETGGCYTAHNVSRRSGGWAREFLAALDSTPGLETAVIEPRPGRGISVSYLRAR